MLMSNKLGVPNPLSNAKRRTLKLIKRGLGAWNTWREENPTEEPDLNGANLREADLNGGNFVGTNLVAANLTGAALIRADLGGADLRGADLRRAYLDSRVAAKCL